MTPLGVLNRAMVEIVTRNRAVLDPRRVEEVDSLADRPELQEFAALYLGEALAAHDTQRELDQLAALALSHRDFAAQRSEGRASVRVLLAEDAPAALDLGGAALVQVVTDDGPYIVDTVLVTLDDLNWSVGELFHPQFGSHRDDRGGLERVVGQGDGSGAEAESWVQVVATPPLGQSPATSAEALVELLTARLTALQQAHRDTAAMDERLREVAGDLRARDESGVDEDVAEGADLLDWMAQTGFIPLGAADLDVVEGRFEPRPGTALGVLDGAELEDAQSRFDAVRTDDDRHTLVIAKDSVKAGIQRPGLRDYVAVRSFDPAGELVAERRFVGLFSPSAYAQPLTSIPVLRRLLAAAREASGFPEGSHGANAVEATLSSFPRDELFGSPPEQTVPMALAVASGTDRPQVRVFVRTDPWQRFAHVLVMAPRDHYSTDVRLRIHRILQQSFGAEPIAFSARVGDALAARLFSTVPIATDERVDLDALRSRIAAAVRSWEDDFVDLAKGLPSSERGVEFSPAYEESNTVREAMFDLQTMNALEGPHDIRLVMYRPDRPDRAALRVKVISRGAPTSLSTAMPVWDSLGLHVLDERTFEVHLRGHAMSIVDFGLVDAEQYVTDLADRHRILEAFEAIQAGRCDVDQLNRLVIHVGLTWRQVQVLRAISRYLQQAGTPYSQSYIAQTLLTHPELTRGLVEAFEVRFDPDRYADLDAEAATLRREADAEALAAEFGAGLDAVTSLDQDRILREFASVIAATVRTNAYQHDRPALGLKILCERLEWLPRPRPKFEVFVHSPRVEGVHLRYGLVARGGLRWSDRPEDFRTEVLGLVKAQMVKNTVIVPVGAKGGFLPRRVAAMTDGVQIAEEGQACYEIFIETLLDVTDNLVDQVAVHPERVVVHDGDDSYLVVAADKGTAKFSDVANGIALRRGFWLGDGFASGGSKGYDHKGMGITARGAWESVRRHLAELGIDDQRDDFTVVGIGDMSGDVFGNGMLLSEHIRLVGAFNHLHVFVDPDPDAASGFAERRRLFELPRSSWEDYDSSLISQGGGVFRRDAKRIEVTDQMRRALGLADEVEALTGDQLVRAVLRGPVDLLFNGGIGTYVKASGETNAEVGDKANDAVRLNGDQVRARTAGEGGNLGWTQRGRIEYARAGGRINTDFIDNSAGVDTSDHEVNIKILLAAAQRAGQLDDQQRDELLPTMTDDVAALVLRHNMNQNTALGLARKRASAMAWVHENLMAALEERVGLDRELESLPSSAQMAELIGREEGLSNPELAALMAWVKIDLAEQVLASDLPDDPFLAERVVQYFPPALQQRFAEQIASHPLRREIITTIAVNRFVDSQGISAAHRLSRENDAEIPDVVRAQLAARSVFAAGALESATVAAGASADVADEMRLAVRKLVERGTRWFLRHRRRPLDIRAQVDDFAPKVQRLGEHLPELLTERGRARRAAKLQSYLDGGVQPEVADLAATAPYAHLSLSMVEVATRHHHRLELTAATFVAMVERLHLDDLLALVEELPRTSEWDLQARSAMRDDLLQVQTDLTAQALEVARRAGVDGHDQAHGDDRLEVADAEAVVAAWSAQVPRFEQRVEQLLAVCEGEPDLARISVGLRIARGFLEAVRAG